MGNGPAPNGMRPWPGIVGFVVPRLPFVLTLAVSIWLSALGLAAVVNSMNADAVCSVSYLFVDCATSGQSELKVGAYLGAFGFCLLVLAINQVALRPYAVYPFLNFVLLGALACILFDHAFQMPVKNFGPLYSGMFNSINFIIALSFLFFLTIMRLSPAVFPRFVLAALMSYGQTVIGFSIYFWLHQGFLGATIIYLGFAIYAFGVFSIHLMSVFAMVAAVEGKQPRPAPDRAANRFRKRMHRYGPLSPDS